MLELETQSRCRERKTTVSSNSQPWPTNMRNGNGGKFLFFILMAWAEASVMKPKAYLCRSWKRFRTHRKKSCRLTHWLTLRFNNIFHIIHKKKSLKTNPKQKVNAGKQFNPAKWTHYKATLPFQNLNGLLPSSLKLAEFSVTQHLTGLLTSPNLPPQSILGLFSISVLTSRTFYIESSQGGTPFLPHFPP